MPKFTYDYDDEIFDGFEPSEEEKGIIDDAIGEDDLTLPKDIGDDMAEEGMINK